MTEHLRLNGVYWGLTALHLLGHPEALPRQATIDFVLSCQRENGGFGAAPGHDAHMLYTVSAIQILGTVDAVEELNRGGQLGKEKVGRCEHGKTLRLNGAEYQEQSLRIYKIEKRVPLLETNGAKPILAFCTAP